MNSVYISKIDVLNATAQLPAQVYEAVRSSIQGAHIAAQNITNPQLSQIIISQANEAFVAGMLHALMVAGIVMAIASVVTLIILPSRVRPAQEDDDTTNAVDA